MSAPFSIATWNVNGVRAREAQLLAWLTRDAPDVVCLQEIKALPTQVPDLLCHLAGYQSYWHGAGGYSGVALLVKKARFPSLPGFSHPPFDRETRIVCADLGEVVVASVYVPNGGKNFAAKMSFLESLAAFAEAARSDGKTLVIAGDLNVARTDFDIHPREKKPGVIGQRSDERALLERILDGGAMVDVGRALAPDDHELFTWWAPWRNLRQRNIGWRIDYVLASSSLATRAASCVVLREEGTSDHAPVVATFT